MTVIMSIPPRILFLSVMFSALITVAPQYYDPTARDFAETCNEMAEFAGENFCRVFNICCRDRANNRLNGDRCQLADPTNGCQLTTEGSVEFLRCRAYNCTPEVTTTTTTTTTTTSRAAFLNSSSTSTKAGTFVAVVAISAALRLSFFRQCYH